MGKRDGVVLYRGFGAGGRVFVVGRALAVHVIPEPVLGQSRWRNLRAMLRRAHARGVGYAVIRATIGSSVHEFSGDDEGFFSGWMPVQDAHRLDNEWIEVEAQLVGRDGGGASSGAMRHAGLALYPQTTPEYLVISDIDDTVLQSRVTNFLRAVQTLAFGNARTRLPFPGVAAFYTALHRGAGSAGHNPLFYVSSSPWNLYDVIVQFLEIQGIPAGPVMLRDLDVNLGMLSSRRHHEHKLSHIRRVMNTYPAVPAVLIGDSSQQDPEIYRGIVREFAGRVRAIYIRNVSMNAERSAAIERLAKEVLAAGSSLVLADDTLTAAKHAVEIGLIPARALEGIGEEKKADEGATSEKAKAPGARDFDDAPTPTVVVQKR